ncbi:MAG TPA: DMT family transporter [Polyangia bacterium]
MVNERKARVATPGGDALGGAPGRRPARLAIILLSAVCLFWGMTFLLMQIGTERIRAILGTQDRLGPSALFLFVRFGLAALLMPLCLPSSVRRLDRVAWAQGLLLSLPFSLGFILQVFGLSQADVSPSQSAFLTSLFVVATPILDALVRRRRPPLGVLVGIPLAVVGAAFMQGPPRGGLSLGAWMTIACAVVFAVHILVTDYSTRRADPMAITLTTLLFSVVWMGLALAAAPGAGALRLARLPALLLDPRFALAEVLCALLATVVALSVLNRWQKELDPSRAAIAYTSEPVFAAIISLAAGRDHLSGWLFFGAGMILLANLSAELIGKRAAPPVGGAAEPPLRAAQGGDR